jgi:hypothetical protein
MSEGIEERCPDGENSNPNPEQLTDQQENLQHKTPNNQGTESIEDQLLNAIGMDNAKKDQKATNPLLKHKKKSKRTPNWEPKPPNPR